jgi:hypothetical protein
VAEGVAEPGLREPGARGAGDYVERIVHRFAAFR